MNPASIIPLNPRYYKRNINTREDSFNAVKKNKSILIHKQNTKKKFYNNPVSQEIPRNSSVSVTIQNPNLWREKKK